jgi:hypothetical protein
MRMKMLGVAATACAVGLFLSAAAAQNGKGGGEDSDVAFKSSQAKSVQAAYARGLAEAEKEYNRKVLEVTQTYQQGLRGPLTAATKGGNLDEANRIDAEIKRVTEEIADLRKAATRKAKPAAAGRGGLVIERARYGMAGTKDTWVDITRETRAAVRGGGLVGLNDAPRITAGDPSPGQRKTLEIVGTLDGRPFSLHMRDGSPFETYFGEPRPVE